MLTRNDYTHATPPTSFDIHGEIIPVEDINGRLAKIRLEDLYYLQEFMCRVLAKPSYSIPTDPSDTGQCIYNVGRSIVDIDTHTKNNQEANTLCLHAILSQVPSGYTYNGTAREAVIDLITRNSVRDYSGLTEDVIYSYKLKNKPMNADLLRRMYWWLNQRAGKFKLIQRDYTATYKFPENFFVYSSRTSGLTWHNWTSSSSRGVYDEPFVAACYSPSSGFVETRTGGSSEPYVGALYITNITDWATYGKYYLKEGGIQGDITATVSIGRSDVVSAYALVEYTASILGSRQATGGVKFTKTVAVPMNEVGTNEFSFKVFDRALALQLLSDAGYDTSLIGGEVSKNQAGEDVHSLCSFFCYCCDDIAKLPAQWTWRPS